MKKIISIHQPAYLPWLGYLHKICYADFFVYLDNVEFSKRSFIRRTLIPKSLASLESQYLSIPLKNHKDTELISNLVIDNTNEWREVHVRKLKAIYQKAPFFKKNIEFVESLIRCSHGTNFSKYAYTSLLMILEYFQIQTTILKASELMPTRLPNSPHENNMKIVSILEGDIYLSGSQAMAYQNEKKNPEGLIIEYQKYFQYMAENPYRAKENFINGLTFLDALFTIDVSGIKSHLSNYQNFINRIR